MQGQSFSWFSFANLGGIAGFLSLSWQIGTAARKRGRRPKLHARPFDADRDLDTWQIGAGPVVQKVATVEITNVGKSLAARCVASATVVRSPDGVRLRNAPVPLKWAGTDPTPHDTGTFPIDLGPDDHQRLDMVFSRNVQSLPGCWLAAPLARSRAEGAPQFHLPPGAYEIEVVVDAPTVTAAG
jgi:hypothetical protein